MRQERLTWHQRGWLWLRLGVRLALAVLAVFLVTRFGGWLLALFAPFVAALITAAILNPLVKWFQRRMGWSRQVLTMLLLLLIFGLLGGALFLLIHVGVSELIALAQNWDGLLAKLQGVVDQVEQLFAHLWTLVPPQLTDSAQSLTDTLLSWLSTATSNLLNGIVDSTKNTAMGLPSFLVALLIFIMATYFLTADYPYLRSRAVQHVDEGLLRFFGQLRTTALGAFGGYLKAELLLSVGVFFILLAGFLITGQSYGLLLALGLAILDFIPLLGAGTVMVPWAVVALVTQDYPAAIQIMIIWGIVAIFRRVMEPKFVGDQTGLSPVLSLVGIYVGMKLAGVLGMILSPIFMLVVLNLAGMGMFRGLAADVAAAARDIAGILSGPFDKQ